MKYILLAAYLLAFLAVCACGKVRLNDVGQCVVNERETDKVSTLDQLIDRCEVQLGKR